tara:strand:+ start:827 stop:1078 length:252 start_codon:yes stop_codon:yes gene_type:complete
MNEEVQTDNSNQEAEVPTPGDQPSAENVTLGVGDLQNAIQIIDIAMTRGAFRANEAAQIGTVFDKLTKFVASVQNSMNADDNT